VDKLLLSVIDGLVCGLLFALGVRSGGFLGAIVFEEGVGVADIVIIIVIVGKLLLLLLSLLSSLS